MTNSDPFICPEGISSVKLSMWRDNTLDVATAESLHSHIATCAACQARLAGFDRVALALHSQSDLEPQPQLWSGIQSNLMRKEQQPMLIPRQTILRGGIAAASVLLVIALFALVLLNHHSPGSSTSIAATNQPSPTPVINTSVSPTSVPTAISFNGLLSPQQAWGAGAVEATINVSKLNLHGFIDIAGITPDGQHILGTALSADGKYFTVGWLNVATGAYDLFEQSPVYGPTGKENDSPNCCLTDGRFVVGSNGGPSGSNINIPWSYDTQTGQFHLITVDNSIDGSMFFAVGVINGIAYYNGFDSQQRSELYALNLLTNVLTPVPGMASFSSKVAFAAPYILYTTSEVSNSANSIHIHNLQTNTDVAVPNYGNIGFTESSEAFSVATLFYMLSSDIPNVLYEWDQVFTAGTTPRPVETLTVNSIIVGATPRVVFIVATSGSCQSEGMGTVCNYGLAWDRTLHKLVLLSTSKNTSIWTNGNHFLVVDNVAKQAALYDSSTFPTS